MTLEVWAEFAVYIGTISIILGALALVTFAGTNSKGDSSPIVGIFKLIFDKKTKKLLLQDFHNPNIVAGGILGISIKLLQMGAVLLSVGAVPWALYFLSKSYI